MPACFSYSTNMLQNTPFLSVKCGTHVFAAWKNPVHNGPWSAHWRHGQIAEHKLPQSRVSFLYTYIYKHIIRWLVTFRHFSILFTLLYLLVILVHAIWSFWPGQDPRHPGLPEFHPPHPRMTIDLLLQQGFRCNRHKMVLKESAFDETPFHPPRRTIFF